MQTTQNQGDSRTNKFGLLVRSHCVSRGRSRNASSANSPKISVLKFAAFSFISSTTVDGHVEMGRAGRAGDSSSTDDRLPLDERLRAARGVAAT